jgi:hypothetical protein
MIDPTVAFPIGIIQMRCPYVVMVGSFGLSSLRYGFFPNYNELTSGWETLFHRMLERISIRNTSFSLHRFSLKRALIEMHVGERTHQYTRVGMQASL